LLIALKSGRPNAAVSGTNTEILNELVIEDRRLML